MTNKKQGSITTGVVIIIVIIIAIVVIIRTTSSPKEIEQESLIIDTEINEVEEVEVIKEINISGVNYLFNQSEIRVKKGEKIKIIFTSNEGLHNWTVDEFSTETERVTTGKTSSIEFTADKIGEFEYYCNVGNHRALGMIGKLIVE